MKEQIKQRYQHYSDEQLVEILKTGRPNYTLDAIDVAEELLKERNYAINFTINRRDPAGYSSTVERPQRGQGSRGRSNAESKSPGLFAWVGGILVVGLLASWIFGGAGKPSTVSMSIDNPTYEEYTFTIDDGEPQILGANQWKKLALEPGVHVFKMDTLERKFSLQINKKTILNPTQSEYVMEEIIYSANHTSTPGYGLDFDNFKKVPFNIFLIDSLPVMGPYKQVKDFVLPVVDYSLNSEVPMSMQTQNKFGNISKTKLHRMSDFVNIQERENISFIRRKEYKKFGLSKEKTKDAKAESQYLKARSKMLRDASEGAAGLIGEEQGYLAFIEINRKGSYALVNAVKDGPSAFYTGYGQEQINKSAKDGSHAKAKNFLELMMKNKKFMTADPELSIPKEGHIRYNLVTNTGKYSFEIDLITLLNDKSNLGENGKWNYLLKAAEKTMKEVKSKAK